MKHRTDSLPQVPRGILLDYYKSIKQFSLAAWLVVVPTIGLTLTGLGFFMFFAGNIIDVVAGDNPFGVAAFVIFVLPFIILTLLNIWLLKGVLKRNPASLILAALIVSAEWMIGIVLGGDALSSALFDGKQYVTGFSHHQIVLALIFAVVTGVNFYVFGKELRKKYPQL